MSDNTVTVDGVVYDMEKLSEEGKIVCSLLMEVQRKVHELSREVDIYQASAVTLSSKLKDLLPDEQAEVKQN
mgnify:CR=1 FL=1|jgi:hypothetical protein|tara:strand:- start:550 stop:765 length:216 start_codon:yes stop_codon:yes gene_type:complete